MRVPLQLLQPIRYPGPLSVGVEIRLDRPAMDALRFREVNVKESFTLQDTHGAFFRCALRSVSAEGGAALVFEVMARSPESPLDLSLVCAVLARQRMILVTQKATELGITRLQPVFTERSVGPNGLEHEKAHAWPGQALRACKQCRRASVPLVSPTIPLTEELGSDAWKRADLRLYLDEGLATFGLRSSGEAPPEGPFRTPNTERQMPNTVCLAVGPEGGWTDAEREQLREAGALPLALGGRILRAETAVLVGVTLIQHWFGDLTASG